MATITENERQLRKLIKQATGMKVYKSSFHPLVFNVYYSIVQEYKDESNPHITIIQGSWHAINGGEYKISIYTPTIVVGNKRKINIQYDTDMSYKTTVSEEVQQFIAERTDVAGGYYEYINVIPQKYALEAAEMVKQETKEKCQIAFRNFMLRATLANVSGESLDFEKEFAETMSKI